MSCMMYACMVWYEKYDMSCSKMPNWSCFITKVCTIKPWGKARKPFLIPIHFSFFFKFSYRVTLSWSSFIRTLFLFCFTKILLFVHIFLAPCFFDTFLLFQQSHSFFFNIAKYNFEKMNKTLIFQFFLFKIKHHPISRKE